MGRWADGDRRAGGSPPDRSRRGLGGPARSLLLPFPQLPLPGTDPDRPGPPDHRGGARDPHGDRAVGVETRGATGHPRNRGDRIARGGSAWILPLLLGLLSCAYFNTFFVAKKSFNAAKRSIEESETERLPSDARRNFETTIVQCKKVLDRHAGSRWADDAVYLMAESYFEIGEYDSALLRIEQLREEFPESSFRDDASFLAGLTYTELRQFDRAAAMFDTVRTESPEFERGDEILFTLGETATQQRRKEEAIERYEELVSRYPDSKLAEDALQRVGELHFEAGTYDTASIYFERLLATTRDEETRIDGAILQAQCLTRLGEAERALDLLEEVLPEEAREPIEVETGGQLDPTGQSPVQRRRVPQRSGLGDEVARIRLQQAAALNRLERHDEAIEILRDVTVRYGSNPFSIEAQFQIGYTYETLLDSLASAKAAYEKAVQMPGRSVFKNQARQRAVALQSLADLQQQEGSGDAALEQRAEAALRIAELLYLDRGLVPDAVEKYREVEEAFPEAKAAPRAAYALAYIRWKERADSVGALAEFRDLVERYPASTQARGAIDLLADFGADTAGLADLLVTPEPEEPPVSDTTAAGVADSMRIGPPAPV
ncbi:MAG: tetratricopeptide repeat protein, partial [Candidatus Eisenbacteria bacterium]|nr:tetratricopeptide repeat protein [Candidatus Latescibacterota bacterium]MBD3302500.1 tetratricopeptide repeat protein [Candidatus Eisenbacteria bacterium]